MSSCGCGYELSSGLILVVLVLFSQDMILSLVEPYTAFRLEDLYISNHILLEDLDRHTYTVSAMRTGGRI